MFFLVKIKKTMEATKVDPENAPEKIELEKNDLAALLIAGFITLLPAALVVLAIFLGVAWFFTR